MSDLLPDNDPASEAHVPWESIDAAGEQAMPSNEPQRSRLPTSKSEVQECQPMDDPAPPAPTKTPPVRHALRPAVRERETPTRGGGWTLPVLCAGIALAACCVLIPQADANRRLVYERQMLAMDLQTVERQISVNNEFLKKVSEDPALAQRLAERQMKVIPEGTRVLELQHEQDGTTMSPFQLVSVAPPPPLPPYRPVGGTIANLCYNPHTRLYVIAAALLMMAMGLVLGYAPQR